MKKIALIGSTGSIGRQTVAVCARYPERFRIVAMAANASEERFAAQVRSVRPAFAALRTGGGVPDLPQGVRFARGEEAFAEACAYAGADVAVIAVTGFAGLKAAFLAIGAGMDIALANKESLVAGGDLVMAAAREKGVNIFQIGRAHV